MNITFATPESQEHAREIKKAICDNNERAYADVCRYARVLSLAADTDLECAFRAFERTFVSDYSYFCEHAFDYFKPTTYEIADAFYMAVIEIMDETER